MAVCTQAAQTRVPKTKPTWKMNRIELAKTWVAHYGGHTHRNGGGWIYSATERPIIQGWERLAQDLERTGVIVVGKGINWSKSGGL